MSCADVQGWDSEIDELGGLTTLRQRVFRNVLASHKGRFSVRTPVSG